MNRKRNPDRMPAGYRYNTREHNKFVHWVLKAKQRNGGVLPGEMQDYVLDTNSEEWKHLGLNTKRRLDPYFREKGRKVAMITYYEYFDEGHTHGQYSVEFFYDYEEVKNKYNELLKATWCSNVRMSYL